MELVLWVTIIGLSIINIYQLVIIGKKDRIIQLQEDLIIAISNEKINQLSVDDLFEEENI